MQLQLALICDHAEQTSDGKLDIKGVFNDLAAPGFPAKHDMFLVLIIEWNRNDQGTYEFQIDLIDPSMRSTMTIRGHSEVDLRDLESPPARTQIIMPLQDIIFPTAGQYKFHLQVKGRTYEGPSLFLMEAEIAGEASK